MKKRFNLQDDCSLEDFYMLHPNILVIFATVLTFADKRGLPVVVTSIISDRINVIAKSKTHERGRALDVSDKGWDKKDIDDLDKELLKKHSGIAAIAASDLKPRPLVHHDYKNQGSHMHFQCKR